MINIAGIPDNSDRVGPLLEELERTTKESTKLKREIGDLRRIVEKLEALRVEDRVALAASSAECCTWKRAFQIILEGEDA